MGLAVGYPKEMAGSPKDWRDSQTLTLNREPWMDVGDTAMCVVEKVLDWSIQQMTETNYYITLQTPDINVTIIYFFKLFFNIIILCSFNVSRSQSGWGVTALRSPCHIC